MMDVWTSLCSQQWMIQREALETIAAIAARQNDPAAYEALQAERGRPLVNSRRVSVRGETENVAVIPVIGPIFPRANLFSMMSGATSTDVLAQDLRTALNDRTIDAIILEIDSPGGAVSGINELAQLIYDARAEKPVIAYGQHTVASAAYWIASAAREIVIDATAPVGSIGVILSVQDSKDRDARSGVRTWNIVSNVSPDKIIDPSMDEGRAKLQKVVDDMATVFVETVARNRGITSAQVTENYGRGGILVGASALTAGMVDQIGSLESVIAEQSAAGRAAHNRRIFGMARGNIIVSNTQQLREAFKAGHTAEEVTIEAADIQKLEAAAKAAGIAEANATAETAHKASLEKATAEARADGVKAERDRVAALNAIAMPGFEPVVTKAIADGTTVEACMAEITKTARDRGTTVAGQRKDSPAPLAHGGAAAGADTEHQVEKSVVSAGWKAAAAAAAPRKRR
jgi:signal peptide peptidase SppA